MNDTNPTPPRPEDCPPPPEKETTPRGRHDPILDPHYHGKDVDEPGKPGPAPRDSDNGASKDARDRGNNGNPAQSSGRVSMQEQNAQPDFGGEPPP